MITLLERDGPAACPDDPLRVGDINDWTAEEQRRHDREWSERHIMHRTRLLNHVNAVLAGNSYLVDIEGQAWGKADLFESITANEEYDILAPLLLGNSALGLTLINKFCDERATHAANRDMENWHP